MFTVKIFTDVMGPFFQESFSGSRMYEAIGWFPWLELVLRVSSSDLTLLVGLQERHPACKHCVAVVTRVSVKY